MNYMNDMNYDIKINNENDSANKGEVSNLIFLIREKNKYIEELNSVIKSTTYTFEEKILMLKKQV